MFFPCSGEGRVPPQLRAGLQKRVLAPQARSKCPKKARIRGLVVCPSASGSVVTIPLWASHALAGPSWGTDPCRKLLLSFFSVLLFFFFVPLSAFIKKPVRLGGLHCAQERACTSTRPGARGHAGISLEIMSENETRSSAGRTGRAATLFFPLSV